jgi:signal transduction histidine kinase
VSRLPIRLRLTLPFAFAMAALLAAMAFFVYERVGGALLSTIDANLAAQLDETLTNARRHRALVDPDSTEGPTVAQVRSRAGGVIASQPATLPPIGRLRGLTHTTRLTTHLPTLDQRWRMLEVPATLEGRPVVVVIARSLSGRDQTLARLEHEFLLAAPAALLLAILAGYGLAAAALRPVEAMRRRAADVTAHEPGRRLPVPPAKDEIRALAVTLNDMLARLEAAFEHERRFLGDASHELRTPLALLRAELELALRRPRSRAELQAAVRSAAEETERLTRLAEDLLLLARGDRGRLPVRLEPVDAQDVLTSVRQRFAARAEELGRPVRVAAAPGVPLRADRLHLEQAVGNLVSNALEHGAGTVTLGATRVDGRVEMHVTDEGGGFPPEFAGHAFDRFSRADDARSGGGSGLGLAIVALVADAHGGEAGIGAAPGGGADAWIAIAASSDAASSS